MKFVFVILNFMLLDWFEDDHTTGRNIFYCTWHWKLRTSNSHRIVLRLADRQHEDAPKVRYNREVRLRECFIHPEKQEERYLWADSKHVSVQQAHIYSNIIILFYFCYLALHFHVSCFFKWLICDSFKIFILFLHGTLGHYVSGYVICTPNLISYGWRKQE